MKALSILLILLAGVSLAEERKPEKEVIRDLTLKDLKIIGKNDAESENTLKELDGKLVRVTGVYYRTGDRYSIMVGKAGVENGNQSVEIKGFAPNEDVRSYFASWKDTSSGDVRAIIVTVFGRLNTSYKRQVISKDYVVPKGLIPKELLSKQPNGTPRLESLQQSWERIQAGISKQSEIEEIIINDARKKGKIETVTRYQLFPISDASHDVRFVPAKKATPEVPKK